MIPYTKPRETNPARANHSNGRLLTKSLGGFVWRWGWG